MYLVAKSSMQPPRVIATIRFILIVLYFTLPHHLISTLQGTSWTAIKPHDICALLLLTVIPAKNQLDIVSKSYLLLIIIYLIRACFTSFPFESFLIPLKLFEYFIIMLNIKALAMKYRRMTLWFTLVIIVLTYIAHLIGYQLGPSWDNRFFGHYGGPYEISAILLLLLLFDLSKSRWSFIRKAGIYLPLLWFTYTKAVVVSLFISRPLILLLFASLSAPILFLVSDIIEGNRIADLFNDFTTLSVLNLFDICRQLPTFDTRDEYFLYFSHRNDYALDDASLSTSQRFFSICLPVANLDLPRFLFGYGPNYFGTLDNSFLRVFTDIGIVGPIFLFNVMRRVLKTSNKYFILAVLFTIALSDVFFSARFFVTAYILFLIRSGR